MKHAEKVVQTRESGLSGDIGDRKRSRFQQFLCMVNSHPEDLVKHGALKFFSKGAFQGSAGNAAVRNDVVHRQIPSGKISLDVSECGADLRVFHGEDLCTLASHNALWGDPLRRLWWALAINQSVEESRRLVGHTFEIVPDAGQRH